MVSWMSIPYYGIVRKSRSRRIEMPYDLECIGHFHQAMEIPVAGAAKTVVNGSWIEKESFAWDVLGVLSVPQQYFFGVSSKRCRTWDWKLDLKKNNKGGV